MKLPRPSDTETVEGDNCCDDLREIKEKQTNHWDMDLMSRQQLNELANESRRKHRRHSLKRIAAAGFIVIALAMITATTLLFLRS